MQYGLLRLTRGLTIVVVGLLLTGALTSSASAHHKTGHGGGPPSSREADSENSHKDKPKSADLSSSSGPPDGPGNSGAAHWCKLFFNDPEADHQFSNHGQCVSFYAHQRNAEREKDDDDETLDNENDNNSGKKHASSLNRNGDFQIIDARVNPDGTFRLRGVGAEDTISASELKGKDVAIQALQAQPATDGVWTVVGTWTCSDSDGPRPGRFEAHDSDEEDRLSVVFPCGTLAQTGS